MCIRDRYPFINFKPEREVGDQILKVDKLSAVNEEGETLFSDVSFIMNKGEKIALLGQDSTAVTAFYELLAGERDLGEGTIEWGQTITWQYLPSVNDAFFTAENDLELLDWLRQFSDEKEEQFIRGFLGRMFFAGDDIYKKSSVLSGGEKVRCMLSKIMLAHPNFLLLNEPTGHLDLESITALNNAVKDFPGNLIMSSHDHELIASTVNRIIEITPNGIIDQLMDYNDYVKSDKVEKLREGLMAATA